MIATLSAVGSVSASRSVRSGRFYCRWKWRFDGSGRSMEVEVGWKWKVNGSGSRIEVEVQWKWKHDCS